MNDLYKLKEMLCEELEKYGKKGDLNTGGLDVVDKLAHAIKNLNKIIEETEEGGYSGRYMPMYAYEGGGGNRGGGNRGGGSYARGRGGNRGGGRGGYSREGGYSGEGGYSRDGMAEKLRELTEDAPDEKTRREIERLADKLEMM